ncbi:UNVERIFIED_CONTAM: hypothetical protein GTU68_053750, partial [Idotea baltica]|nr:hypothetical protein [Idotea baltica]
MILGVIPARYASTRFPGKPLVDIKGKSMIQRVYEQCKKSPELSEVIVATDDARIQDHVLSFGGKVEMTGDHHVSGTERIAEVASRHPEFSHVINIQGDEPYIDPNQISLLCQTLTEAPHPDIATLIRPLKDASRLIDPNVVKVVKGNQGQALYFSRAPIPF